MRSNLYLLTPSLELGEGSMISACPLNVHQTVPLTKIRTPFLRLRFHEGIALRSYGHSYREGKSRSLILEMLVVEKRKTLQTPTQKMAEVHRALRTVGEQRMIACSGQPPPLSNEE